MLFFIRERLLLQDCNIGMLSVYNYNEVLRKIPNFRNS